MFNKNGNLELRNNKKANEVEVYKTQIQIWVYLFKDYSLWFLGKLSNQTYSEWLLKISSLD